MPAEQQDFVQELEVMKAVKKMGQHINIVNFLGCSTQGGRCDDCVCVCVCVRELSVCLCRKEVSVIIMSVCAACVCACVCV